ncbi:MAG: hypothetical protein HY381_01425 [Candidatus Chisholmbacteria bacterium]|nr:hypothetical protein [Candidatus Chisholmbacteria bacterium]
MNERRLVFAPKGLIQQLINELGPAHPKVMAEIEARGHDAGDFVEVGKDSGKHDMMDLKRGDE